MGVSENSGFSPQIIHLFIGSSIIFTIHCGVPLFLETPIYHLISGYRMKCFMFVVKVAYVLKTANSFFHPFKGGYRRDSPSSSVHFIVAVHLICDHRLRKRFLCVYLNINMCILYDQNNPSEKEDGTCLSQNDLLLYTAFLPFSESCASYLLLRQEHSAMGHLVQHRVHWKDTKNWDHIW